jgi:hypothetical protein
MSLKMKSKTISRRDAFLNLRAKINLQEMFEEDDLDKVYDLRKIIENYESTRSGHVNGYDDDDKKNKRRPSQFRINKN